MMGALLPAVGAGFAIELTRTGRMIPDIPWTGLEPGITTVRWKTARSGRVKGPPGP